MMPSTGSWERSMERVVKRADEAATTGSIGVICAARWTSLPYGVESSSSARISEEPGDGSFVLSTVNVARAGLKSSTGATASGLPSPSRSWGAGSVARCSVTLTPPRMRKPAMEPTASRSDCVSDAAVARSGSGRRAVRQFDRDLVVRGDASAFGADERAAIETAGVRHDADVIEADFEDDLRGARAGREMEVGDAGLAVERAVEQEVGGEGGIEERGAVGELELFIDVRLDRGAGGEVGAAEAFDGDGGDGAAVRQDDGRIEVEGARGERRGGGGGGDALQRCAGRGERGLGQSGELVGIDEGVRAGAADGERGAAVGDVDHRHDDLPGVAHFVVADGGEVLRGGGEVGCGDGEGELAVGQLAENFGGGEGRPAERQESGEGLAAGGSQRDGLPAGHHSARNGERGFAGDGSLAAVLQGEGGAGGGLDVAALREADVDRDHAGAGGDDDLAPDGGVAGHEGADGVGAFGEADEVAAAGVGGGGEGRQAESLSYTSLAGLRGVGQALSLSLPACTGVGQALSLSLARQAESLSYTSLRSLPLPACTGALSLSLAGEGLGGDFDGDGGAG